ncbi:MAG: alginate lyase family protein [Verrucomicrobiota bacterium]
MKAALARNSFLVALLGLLPATARAAPAQPFVHPGLLQSREDLERMSNGIKANDPVIAAGFQVFRANRFSQSTCVMLGPGQTIGRAPNVNFGQFNDDAAAAYQNALMWRLTGEKAHADKAKQILNAWASTLQRVTGRDGVLMAGLGPFQMVNAAELLRYSNAGWTEAEIRRCEQMLTNVIYPEIKDFAPFANGNWDAAAERTMLAIAVFCNDRAMFERALRYYCDGAGNGRLTYYVINQDGQAQESGRDQQHTQLGLGLLGDCCQIAWNQGLDLYGYADNRLLKGFEYTAKYLLGGGVPFTPMMDRTGRYPWEKISARSSFRPIYEQIFNHYAMRAGLAAPFTERVVEEHVRPEGAMSNHDHTGFGTLLYAFFPPRSAAPPPTAPPAAPGAIIAAGSPQGNRLAWIASVGAADYTIKRSAAPGGPYAVIARNVQTAAYTDAGVAPGTVNYYVAAARNAAGQSADSWETGISAGPPAPWAAQDVGAANVKGSTQFDGRTFTLNGAGAGLGGAEDQFQFASQPMTGDGAVIARFVPQMSAALSTVGVIMRESSAPGSPFAALLIAPQNRRNVESAGYLARFQTRASAGAAAVVAAESPRLGQPYSEAGRMLGYCWLRLSRAGNTFTASSSPDGKEWTRLAEITLPLKSDLLAGLAASSTDPRITTTVMFDNVTVAALPTR